MLINRPLPIDGDSTKASALRERYSQQDQTLSLAGMTWSDFEEFISEEYLGYRVSYFDGVITLVSPSKNHERIAEVIGDLVKAYCRKYNVLYFPLGSTTLKHPPLAGKEPDVSFAFDTDKELPDLAIEVVLSSGGITDLKKYKILGVKEVWFWQNNLITFHHLQGNNYQEITKSNCLPNLSSSDLSSFVNRGLTESPLIIEADFVKQLTHLGN